MNQVTFLFLLSVLAIPACAAYEPPPLNESHPAHADAPSAPRQMPSQTLAYTRADMVGPGPVFAAVKAEKEMSAQSVTAEGKVVATVPSSSQIVVEHGEIKGFMEAMTMGYRADPSSLLEGLKFGDRIRFTIDVPNKAIVKIEKLK